MLILNHFTEKSLPSVILGIGSTPPPAALYRSSAWYKSRWTSASRAGDFFSSPPDFVAAHRTAPYLMCAGPSAPPKPVTGKVLRSDGRDIWEWSVGRNIERTSIIVLPVIFRAAITKARLVYRKNSWENSSHEQGNNFFFFCEFFFFFL